MKTNTLKTQVLWTALIGSMLAAPLLLSASAQPEGRRGFHRGGRGGEGRILRELDLSDDQRQQMRSLREQGSREKFERVAETRRALNEAVESGADEGTIRQLAFQFGEAEGEAAIERVRINAQFMEILTPEQRQQYETLKAERKQEMEERRERMRERRENRRENPDSF